MRCIRIMLSIAPSGAPGSVVADAAARGPWLSVVVPVFDEEENLVELHRRLGAVLDTVPQPSEIVFVNDGSRDRSGALLEMIQQSDRRVTVVDLAYNSGQHAAVLAGFQISRGDAVVTLDADLQNPPEEIPKLLDQIREGYEVVGGIRQGRKDPLTRKMLGRLVRTFSKDESDYGCMLRAYRRDVVQRILQCRERSLFIPALAAQLARRVTGVPVAHDERRFGRSRYSGLRLMRLGFDWLTGSSTLPIQLVTLFGIVTAFVGLALAGAIVTRVLPTDPGLRTVSALLTILFTLLGAVFVAIGVVGEYVARIYIEVRSRPLYVIESVRRAPPETRS